MTLLVIQKDDAAGLINDNSRNAIHGMTHLSFDTVTLVVDTSV